MENLLKEIRRVHFRLAVQRFLGLLGWCWFASLVIAAGAIVVARHSPLGVADWQWLAASLAAGLVAAIGWTFRATLPVLQAAIEIDRRFGLKERVSSALAMTPADRQTEAGQALIADTSARLRRVDVREKFPIRPPRHLMLLLLPGLLLTVVMIFRPPMKETQVADAETVVQPPLEVKKSADDLRQKLADRRKQAERDGLKDATKLLERIEDGVKDLQKIAVREKALVKLNDLARELQERRKQLGGSGEAIKRQMEKVQEIPPGPADELAKALSNDDFQKAAQALDKLRKELADGKLDPAKKEELAMQIEQLKQKIDQAAQQVKDAQTDMQARANQAEQAGDANAAGKLEDEIQKLQQQAPQMVALERLANMLDQCSKPLRQGQNAQAAEAMQEALPQLQEMAAQQSELKTLDGALEQLVTARRQMNCDQCGGVGCEKCQGSNDDKQPGNPGPGLAQGRGDSAHPDETIKGTFYSSRVPQTVGKGAGQIAGLTGGANLKNQAEADIRKAVSEIEHGSTDPLSGQHLPKKQSEHVREYFDSFREGK